MNLTELKEAIPTRINYGRPSPNLTDQKWQEQFNLMKLYVKPYVRKRNSMPGLHRYESGKEYSNMEYCGATNYQTYCTFMNDMLKNLKSGSKDYAYFGYQIRDLLRFHYDTLRTKYCDGYWQVWLEGE